eukprot:NODE_976_length_1642_cov_6.927809_g805_i0.p1 GENE.NODE_976_length_1642_cov_6.927809_g805_i0~~NODE_976_length_1642_cov_6.927809_g805_i0.p1  ORF type:complete len:529 (+),score=95.51 NODE_976_length_1642_cov_6.927809_g805_i0:178-1587(+)
MPVSDGIFPIRTLKHLAVLLEKLVPSTPSCELRSIPLWHTGIMCYPMSDFANYLAESEFLVHQSGFGPSNTSVASKRDFVSLHEQLALIRGQQAHHALQTQSVTARWTNMLYLGHSHLYLLEGLLRLVQRFVDSKDDFHGVEGGIFEDDLKCFEAPNIGHEEGQTHYFRVKSFVDALKKVAEEIEAQASRLPFWATLSIDKSITEAHVTAPPISGSTVHPPKGGLTPDGLRSLQTGFLKPLSLPRNHPACFLNSHFSMAHDARPLSTPIMSDTFGEESRGINKLPAFPFPRKVLEHGFSVPLFLNWALQLIYHRIRQPFEELASPRPHVPEKAKKNTTISPVLDKASSYSPPTSLSKKAQAALAWIWCLPTGIEILASESIPAFDALTASPSEPPLGAMAVHYEGDHVSYAFGSGLQLHFPEDQEHVMYEFSDAGDDFRFSKVAGFRLMKNIASSWQKHRAQFERQASS